MDQQKETADKEHATKERKKKKEEEDKKKAHQLSNGNSKYKINRKANAKRAWGDCYLNPNSPNNKMDNNSNNSNQWYGNGNRYENQYQNNDN